MDKSPVAGLLQRTHVEQRCHHMEHKSWTTRNQAQQTHIRQESAELEFEYEFQT